MFARTQQVLRISSEEDIVQVRMASKRLAGDMGFSVVNQTKIVTAASELARNTLSYGLGGAATLEALDLAGRIGIRIKFEDSGPGIPDIKLAMKDGFTSGKGMGLGLSGSKRLVDEFEISSTVGVGTVVIITKWK
jgi:serine/threonine-protein kinase RsbT